MSLRWPLAALALLFASHSVLTAQASEDARIEPGAGRYVRWRMSEEFDNGIPSWQSYPLAQDIGYDPSIYTARIGGQSVLRRDVINDGQSVQVVGLIRPLSFLLTSASRLSLM